MGNQRLNQCGSCHQSNSTTGLRSKKAGFICLTCACRMGLVTDPRTCARCPQIMMCGQGCPGTPRGYPLKHIDELEPGDIIPSCPHHIRVRIIRPLIRASYYRTFEVQAIKEYTEAPEGGKSVFPRTFYYASGPFVEVVDKEKKRK